MGVDGTLEISEVPTRGNTVAKEKLADEAVWEAAVRNGIIKGKQLNIAPVQTKNVAKDVRASAPLGKFPLPIELFEQAHTPHLRNFFDAIRYGKELNCPPEIGYETAVAVLKVNDAVKAQRRLEFKHEDFEV